MIFVQKLLSVQFLKNCFVYSLSLDRNRRLSKNIDVHERRMDSHGFPSHWVDQVSNTTRKYWGLCSLEMWFPTPTRLSSRYLQNVLLSPGSRDEDVRPAVSAKLPMGRKPRWKLIQMKLDLNGNWPGWNLTHIVTDKGRMLITLALETLLPRPDYALKMLESCSSEYQKLLKFGTFFLFQSNLICQILALRRKCTSFLFLFQIKSIKFS